MSQPRSGGIIYAAKNGQIPDPKNDTSSLEFFGSRYTLAIVTDNTPELRVQFTKRKDGSVVLRCVRKDGSATWQRHDKHATFFSYHDLSHFVVETTLGFPTGFYGLIADGWDISDTTGKGARGKLSPNSVLVEHVVGLLERERVGGAAPLSAAEFNEQISEMAGKDSSRSPLTDTRLTGVRERIDELHSQWSAVPAGSTLELTFDRSVEL